MCVCAVDGLFATKASRRWTTHVSPSPHATCPTTYHSYRHSNLSCPRVGGEHRNPCAVQCHALCDASGPNAKRESGTRVRLCGWPGGAVCQTPARRASHAMRGTQATCGAQLPWSMLGDMQQWGGRAGCPRIHGRNMQIAHGWGTQQAAVASRHSGGVIGLAAGRETRGTAAADAHGVAGDRAGPNRGRPSRRGRLTCWRARSTDVFLLQASGDAEEEAAAEVTEASYFACQVERILLVRADKRTTDTEPSPAARALGRIPCATAVPSSMQRAVLSRTADPSLAGV